MRQLVLHVLTFYMYNGTDNRVDRSHLRCLEENLCFISRSPKIYVSDIFDFSCRSTVVFGGEPSEPSISTLGFKITLFESGQTYPQ